MWGEVGRSGPKVVRVPNMICQSIIRTCRSEDASVDGWSIRYIVSIMKYISNRPLLLLKSGA